MKEFSPHASEDDAELTEDDLDPDVLAKFRATGPGWQSLINEVLRQAAI